MVETVGGGQADTAVADIVDLLMLVLPPAGGDQLQGIKKGVVEVADLLVVNKADGEMKDVAEHAVGEYRGALTYLRPRSQHWTPQVRVNCEGQL
jgi:LAO/AO transport system kinase